MGRFSLRFDRGELVVTRGRADRGRSSYLRGTARAAAAIAVAALLCWALWQIPFTADTGPVIARGIWCMLLELAGAGVGAAFATARDPNHDVSVGIAGGFVSHALLSALVLLPAGDGGGELLVFMLLPGAVVVGVGAFTGRAVARRPRRS